MPGKGPGSTRGRRTWKKSWMRRSPGSLPAIENPLIPILADMQHAGVRIDTSSGGDEPRVRAAPACLEDRMFELAGSVSAPKAQSSSARALREAQAALWRKTATGTPPTLGPGGTRARTPLPSLLLEHRSLAKLKGPSSTRSRRWWTFVGRIHAKFHQTVTPRAAQLQRSQPAEHSCSGRGRRRIREAFTRRRLRPPFRGLLPGELRILAHLSQDPPAGVFRAGRDVHARLRAASSMLTFFS